MENIVKADVFFFVSTISVALVAIVLVVVLIQAGIILRSIRKTLKRIEIKYLTISKFFESFIRKI